MVLICLNLFLVTTVDRVEPKGFLPKGALPNAPSTVERKIVVVSEPSIVNLRLVVEP